MLLGFGLPLPGRILAAKLYISQHIMVLSIYPSIFDIDPRRAFH